VDDAEKLEERLAVPVEVAVDGVRREDDPQFPATMPRR
jgi:hypothetical protein